MTNIEALKTFQMELLRDYEFISILNVNPNKVDLSLEFYDFDEHKTSEYIISTGITQGSVIIFRSNYNYGKFKNINNAIILMREKIQYFYLNFWLTKTHLLNDGNYFIEQIKNLDCKNSLNKFLKLNSKLLSVKYCILLISAGASEKIARKYANDEINQYFLTLDLKNKIDSELQKNKPVAKKLFKI